VGPVGGTLKGMDSHAPSVPLKLSKLSFMNVSKILSKFLC